MIFLKIHLLTRPGNENIPMFFKNGFTVLSIFVKY